MEGDGGGKGGQRGSSQVRLMFAGQGARGDFYTLHLVLLQEVERWHGVVCADSLF